MTGQACSRYFKFPYPSTFNRSLLRVTATLWSSALLLNEPFCIHFSGSSILILPPQRDLRKYIKSIKWEPVKEKGLEIFQVSIPKMLLASSGPTIWVTANSVFWTGTYLVPSVSNEGGSFLQTLWACKDSSKYYSCSWPLTRYRDNVTFSLLRYSLIGSFSESPKFHSFHALVIFLRIWPQV